MAWSIKLWVQRAIRSLLVLEKLKLWRSKSTSLAPSAPGWGPRHAFIYLYLYIYIYVLCLSIYVFVYLFIHVYAFSFYLNNQCLVYWYPLKGNKNQWLEFQGTLGFLLQLADRKVWIQQSSPWSYYCSRFLNSGFTVPLFQETSISPGKWWISSWKMVILQNFSGNPTSQRFIFTNLSEACCEAMRWKHLSWVSVSKMAAGPVEPDLALYQSLPDLLQNLLRNHLRHPVEPDLALHRSLPDLLRNLHQNPVEPSGSAPKPPRPSPEPSPEPCWTWIGFAPRLPGTFSGTFSGTSPEPCWTWLGSAPKPPRLSPEPSPEPCWTFWLCTQASPTFSGTFPETTLLNLTWLCTEASQTFTGTFTRTLLNLLALHQSLPDLLRNLSRNRVEPELALHQGFLEPSPEPRWTWPGACTSAQRSYFGLKTRLAFAVGEKGVSCWRLGISWGLSIENVDWTQKKRSTQQKKHI